ncbi:MAG: tetratricopeptide repeat protein, partial [Terriglobia bacterium]
MFGIQGVSQANGNYGLPDISIDGLTGLGAGEFATPNVRYSNTVQLSENPTKVYGKHTFKGGFEAQFLRFPWDDPTASRGVFTFGTYTGIPSVTSNNDPLGMADLLLTPQNATVPNGINLVGGPDSVTATNDPIVDDKGKEEIQKLLSARDTAELHSLLASADEKSGKYVWAANEYELAALYYYALSLWEARGAAVRARVSQKIKTLLKSAVRLDPAFGEAHLELGILYAEEGQYAREIAEYHTAIRLDPQRADAHYRLARALLRAGNKAAARKELETFNRLHLQQAAEWEKQRRSIIAFAYPYRFTDLAQPLVHEVYG